ncbi:xanthine dehydrogenase accessory protein XdhC [Phaeobacter gallaeciensis]|uniref:Xanthine dehydrogenase XdhC n=1 Tax=Phaeobacter gallaeciensis TaxID=60890 RepID=A0AAD0EA97_9RHOB|nr:xanthine dehydrogenase accessory protein XdhC [Phaeobacter gallaeciensis]AHD08398.1 molybdenum cofactor sulfurylase [Phaeobacter gallaeciensis DSM 26640]ATE91664.1 xanthine dehydrogenase XdhC [Phaeobacter gallaeciensis]ATE98512.1 xanthine dehydrogenase XdhC [Phaeobacter gallaeciensis]ATF00280.1 xanthine dehydrogenase XdhC [Phaeobacter gallaeciensis]ATF04712.1 xanthine dehydrogenase XdhC [Phaeobacter gallaeciensis]
MGFDLQDLRHRIAAHGPVVRVVIAAIRGSSPREVGTAMLIWKDGQAGTIGGGALEHEAAEAARAQLATGRMRQQTTRALGPDLGQCCGGSVTLWSEIYRAEDVEHQDDEVILRALRPDTGEPPLALRRKLALARSQGQRPDPQLSDGWLLEPVHHPETPLWIWGAGHVGRALVDVLAPMPNLDITWVDTGPERFPSDIPTDVTTVPAAEPAALVPHAPENAQHLVLTYSHALDLALCHALLQRGFAFAGVIGSATKWARFRSRLRELGHRPDQIARLTCPIGDPALGKHPQMIAVGVAAELLRLGATDELKKDRRA